MRKRLRIVEDMNNTNIVTKTEINGSEMIVHVIECYGEFLWTAEEALSIARPLFGWGVSSYSSVSEIFDAALKQGINARFKFVIL